MKLLFTPSEAASIRPLPVPTHSTFWLILLLFLLQGHVGAAQSCAPAVACGPGSAPVANQAFGMGIFRVQLAGLDTVTSGATDGYQDYSCRSHAAQLVRGGTYTLTVQTNPTVQEQVRAWIDFNGDGTYSTSEAVLTSTAGYQHTGSFTVPAGALTSTMLRLRVAADYFTAPTPTACSTPLYSQTEDYGVRVLTTASPRPQAHFVALDTVSCSGVVAFRDQSTNAPTTWRWQFGDGTSSTERHPTHTYAQAGSYTVRLRACNAQGCDSLQRTGYVRVRTDGPRAAACQPATLSYCCGFGITRVQLGPIDQPSTDGAAGYQDFSCPQRATLTADRPYTLQLTTTAVAHDVRVYLDLNDNGQFDLPAEQLYQGASVQSPTIALQIPSTATGLVYNRPLRLRLWTDAAGSTSVGPCVTPQKGQVEDYTVTVVANGAVPTVAFTLRYEQLCGPVRIAVTNQTTGGATSYRWEFGDGTTATAQAPPVHTYASAGTYSLQLIATNAFGTDTLQRTVVVADACPSYCVPTASGGSVSAPAYFTRVQLGDIDNTQVRAPGIGYRDFSAQHTAVLLGQPYVLRAEAPSWNTVAGPWAKVYAWLDRNHDGQFGPSELLDVQEFFSPYQLTLRIPVSTHVGATRLRLAIIDNRVLPVSDACITPLRAAAVEDYTLLVLPDTVAPQAAFAASQTVACQQLVQFRDSSTYAPTQWQWDFGDGETSTQQHPTHRYAATGRYAVSLTAGNAFGSNTVSKPAYVEVMALQQGPRPAACLPQSGTTLPGWGVGEIVFNGVVVELTPDQKGYQDRTCSVAPLRWEPGSTVSLSIESRELPQLRDNHAYVWLDANNDGEFDQHGELVYSSGISQFASIHPKTGSFIVPAQTRTGVPLRLRVYWRGESVNQLLDAVTPNPCLRHESMGQTRDFSVQVGTTTPTQAASSLPALSIYPNPATARVYITGLPAHQAAVPVVVRDMLGRTVYQAEHTAAYLTTTGLELSRLPRGIYWLQLPGPGRSQRIVLQ